MNALDLIAAAAAAPKTHKVVTNYADGSVYEHLTRSAKTAENWAYGERFKIGKNLIDRMSGKPVKVLIVDIIEL